MARYCVYGYENTKTKKLTRIVVKADEAKDFPDAAMFPISDRYPYALQLERAKEYRDYLNLLEEAKEKAAREITITNTVAKKLTGNLP